MPKSKRPQMTLKEAAPFLFEALKELVLRCDGAEGVRADGSNIDTLVAHAVLERIEPGEWL